MAAKVHALNWGKLETLKYLKNYFANQDNGNFRWCPKDATTEIQISDHFAVDLESKDTYPILTVARGSFAPQNISVGNIESFNFDEGSRSMSDLMIHSLTISCMSTVGVEAEYIAAMVFGGIKYNRQAIISRGFIKFDIVNIGAEQKIKGTSDLKIVSVPITVNVTYPLEWKVTPLKAEKLSGVDVIVELEA